MKIKCVDNTLCSTLTLDKEYLVIEEAPEYYVVLDDVNNETLGLNCFRVSSIFLKC